MDAPSKQTPQGADFIFRELSDNRMTICATPEYIKKHKPIKHPEDLNEHSVLVLSNHLSVRFAKSQKSIGDILTQDKYNRKFICETGPYLTELILQGAGVGIRSTWDVRPYLKNGKLIPLLEKYQLETFQKVYLVIPQKKYMSTRVRMLIDYLYENKESL